MLQKRDGKFDRPLILIPADKSPSFDTLLILPLRDKNNKIILLLIAIQSKYSKLGSGKQLLGMGKSGETKFMEELLKLGFKWVKFGMLPTCLA